MNCDRKKIYIGGILFWLIVILFCFFISPLRDIHNQKYEELKKEAFKQCLVMYKMSGSIEDVSY